MINSSDRFESDNREVLGFESPYRQSLLDTVDMVNRCSDSAGCIPVFVVMLLLGYVGHLGVETYHKMHQYYVDGKIARIQDDLPLATQFQQTEALDDYFGGVSGELDDPTHADEIAKVKTDLKEAGIRTTDDTMLRYYHSLSETVSAVEDQGAREIAAEYASKGGRTLISAQAALSDYYKKPAYQTSSKDSAEIVHDLDEKMKQRFPGATATQIDNARHRVLNEVNRHVKVHTARQPVGYRHQDKGSRN